MYGLSELQQQHSDSQHLRPSDGRQDLETVHYTVSTTDQYSSSFMQTRLHPVDNQALHLDLSGHLDRYMSSGHAYSGEVYSLQGTINAQQMYDGSLDNQYIGGQSDPWPNMMFSQIATYPSQSSSAQDIMSARGHFSPPSPSGHYGTVAYPSRPELSRQSSQRSWNSEHGGDSHADGNQRSTASIQGTPLTTIPMLPILVGSNPSANGMLTSRGDKKDAVSLPEQPDPFAAMFLREQLGDEKWEIFTSRLAENRKNGSRSRMKVALTAAIESGSTEFTDFGGASAIDFLAKVEVVKGVLRAFVPHPYNPQKSMSHPYPSSPKGHVVISRSSVLTLSGWSNTQFAYWARRAEGVSVLCNRDRRLHTVAKALQYRLKEVGVFECSPLLSEFPSQEVFSISKAGSSKSSSLNQAKEEPLDDKLAIDEIEMMDPERWVKTFVTGKGLDVIIDDVKKRFGVSQFLRGKHSSLDPFGASVDSDETGAFARGESAQVFMPTFQAESYVHEAPQGSPSKDTPSPLAIPADATADGAVQIKRKASSPAINLPQTQMLQPLSTTADNPSILSTETQSFKVPHTSSTLGVAESPISPISPLSPITPLSSSSSAPVIRQSSPTARVQHDTPVIMQTSPTSMHSFDSPLDSVCAKLNMQGIHVGEPTSSNYTFTPHSQPITPLTPNGITGPSPEHYIAYPRHTHALRAAQEFELAQARCAQSFNLSIPQLPERKHKKQKLVTEIGSEAATVRQAHMAVDDQHSTLGGSHLLGFYSNLGMTQQADSSPSSPSAWQDHSATPA